MTIKPQTIILSLAAILLVTFTAGASIYWANHDDKPASSSGKNIKWEDNTQASTIPPRPNCDDGNVAGKVIGGVGGGAAASNIGGGKGKTAATIAGTLGGAYLGGEYIPLKNATCRN